MEIKVRVDDIDYDTITKNALPLLKEKSDNKIVKIVAGIIDMPGELPMKMISNIPQDTKNELVAYIVNLKKETIATIITESLGKKGFPVQVGELEIINI